MTDLQQGGNAPVSGNNVTVTVAGNPASGVEVDVSAYLLTDAGKVRGDEDMVFYNQPSGGGGAISFTKGGGALGTFSLDLGRMPPAITRIVFCVTIDEAVARRQTLAQVSGARISAGDIAFAPALSQATEAAMIFGELYLRNGAWKFRAVGQGFNGGLGPLARSFGIDVSSTIFPMCVPASIRLCAAAASASGKV